MDGTRSHMCVSKVVIHSAHVVCLASSVACLRVVQAPKAAYADTTPNLAYYRRL
jgi:hypothetical protein